MKKLRYFAFVVSLILFTFLLNSHSEEDLATENTRNFQKWKKDLPTYNSVRFGEVYDAIELQLYAHGYNMEKIFKVIPGGNVSDIQLRIEGATHLNINERGELEMETGLGVVTFTAPVAYQEEGGGKNPVDLAYVLHDKDTYGFKAESYDRTKPLVIDPLLASTYFGGSNREPVHSLAIDDAANIYITGYTDSSDFPTTSGAYNESLTGSFDVFISKFDNGLTTLSASTYLRGADGDFGSTLHMYGTDTVFLAGYTRSSDFPTTSGVYDETFNGTFDVVVAKFDPQLSSLAPPAPDSQANGSDGPITINRSNNLSITVTLDSGDHTGEDADWWMLCKTTLSSPNDWFYFDVPSQSWKRGKLVTRQGPLTDLNPKEIFNQTGFPACTCVFYFGVDMNMNGSFDPGVMFYDKVKVIITQ